MNVGGGGFFDTFMPHAHCFYWRGDILWGLILGNAMVAVAYYAIPFVMWSYRKKVPSRFTSLVTWFGVFIISCGATHIVKTLTLFNGVYWIEVAVDFWTGLVSLYTLVLLRRAVRTETVPP